MGLFGKIKQEVTGKEYIDNFSCPRCGGRVYVKKIFILLRFMWNVICRRK